ncbi:MAG: hypothetical protein M3Y27_30775 [Acidobacteriota bacterium]|nr:hypothetical protein [Acidobacteriota bacterium]
MAHFGGSALREKFREIPDAKVVERDAGENLAQAAVIGDEGFGSSRGRRNVNQGVDFGLDLYNHLFSAAMHRIS